MKALLYNVNQKYQHHEVHCSSQQEECRCRVVVFFLASFRFLFLNFFIQLSRRQGTADDGSWNQ